MSERLHAFFFFPFQCPHNYDLPMRYQQFLFHPGAREMGCGLCELCRVRARTTNTRPKNYVMCSAVQWVLKLVLPVFSAKRGCASSLWQRGGLANASGRRGYDGFLILLLYVIFVAVKRFKCEHRSSWFKEKPCLCCLPKHSMCSVSHALVWISAQSWTLFWYVPTSTHH